MTIAVLSPQSWAEQPGAFVALWTDAAYAYAIYQPDVLVAVALQQRGYPALSLRHPGAAWFERLDHDLNGTTANGAIDTRPAIEQFRDAAGRGAWPEFPREGGDGAHEIGIGPVHGLITEPAHYRLSLAGETVLKLQTRLGYGHRSILPMIRGKSPRLAARFAARVAGDATVAHSLAFAHAAEAALDITPPPRANYLRAVMAELERIANHAGDLALMTNMAGLALPACRFELHRGNFCAAAADAFGHRLMMDAIIPGGVAGDLKTGGGAAILSALTTLENELPGLSATIERSAILQDRLTGLGIIPPALAAAYAAGGVTGRASGQARDARVSPGYAPYEILDLQIQTADAGDAAARVRVRLQELAASIHLIRRLLHSLPEGQIALAPPAGTGAGLGVAESFRGPVWYWLNIDAGVIDDVFIADPSTLLWPLLEHAAATGPAADFPQILNSINPSAAAVDL